MNARERLSRSFLVFIALAGSTGIILQLSVAVRAGLAAIAVPPGARCCSC